MSATCSTTECHLALTSPSSLVDVDLHLSNILCFCVLVLPQQRIPPPFPSGCLFPFFYIHAFAFTFLCIHHLIFHSLHVLLLLTFCCFYNGSYLDLQLSPSLNASFLKNSFLNSYVPRAFATLCQLWKQNRKTMEEADADQSNSGGGTP